MSCSAALAKTLVLVYSSIIFCLGAAALGLGAASLANTTFLAHLVPVSPPHQRPSPSPLGNPSLMIAQQETAIACLIAGIIIIIISFMGCFGTCFAYTRKCLLGVMTTFTLVVVVVSVASFVVIFMYQDIVRLAARRRLIYSRDLGRR